MNGDTAAWDDDFPVDECGMNGEAVGRENAF